MVCLSFPRKRTGYRSQRPSRSVSGLVHGRLKEEYQGRGLYPQARETGCLYPWEGGHQCFRRRYTVVSRMALETGRTYLMKINIANQKLSEMYFSRSSWTCLSHCSKLGEFVASESTLKGNILHDCKFPLLILKTQCHQSPPQFHLK